MRRARYGPPPPASRPGSEFDRRWNHNVRYWGYGFADWGWKVACVIEVICAVLMVLLVLALCGGLIAKLLGYDV